MKVGLIGLGKMGLNIGQNLLDHNHEVVAFDLNARFQLRRWKSTVL